jgi:L-amino acid N-acyltransferase YncA
MVGTDPNHRRAGLGRALYERFFDDMRERGVRRVSAVTWPGNRVSVAFHRALGFEPAEGPGTQNLYGTRAYPDYDADGDDRVVFSREL